MRAFGFISLAVAGTALLGGCASTSGARTEPTTTAAAPAQQQHGMGMMGDMCPMQVQGTTVRASDVEGGLALDFTTSTADVAELRQRVRRMAEMHGHGGGMMMGHGRGGGEHEHGSTGGAGHAGGGQGGMMMGGMMMPPATTSVEDIEGGARLVLRPKDPAQLQALREHGRMRAQRMAGGECPMMSARSRQPTPPPPSAGGAEHESHHPPGK